jgi:hypothetical protein
VVPETGELAGFGCGHRYQHEVTEIAAGLRYSISMWMTADTDRAEIWN